jgi:alkanesulfonate monooxygenase SsuD/methylene tetrahydromethanopterin reductase-like flavin-dependent oxidoreductase (luciferase family)
MFMMRFDMRAPGRSAAERAALYRAAVDMAAWGDANGCASIAVSEHHASDDGYLPSPFPLAAAMAAVTTTTPIVVAAALLPLYEPVRLAEDLIVLDHLSGGRVMVVLGLGYRPVEYELHGVDYADRGRIADEKLAALLDALAGASTGTATPPVTPPPFSPGGPMVAWGGATRAAARRAGRSGIGFFAQADRPGLREAYEHAAREAGHEPGMCFLPSSAGPLSTFVNDDLDAGWRDVGPALLADAVPYFEWNEAAGSAGYTVSLSRSRTVEDLRRERGSHRVVTVAEAVELVRTVGMLSLQPLCGGLDPEVAWPYLRRVAEEVAPAVHAPGGAVAGDARQPS